MKALDSLDCLDSLCWLHSQRIHRGGADSTGRPHQKGLTWAAKKMVVCNFRELRPTFQKGRPICSYWNMNRSTSAHHSWTEQASIGALEIVSNWYSQKSMLSLLRKLGSCSCFIVKPKNRRKPYNIYIYIIYSYFILVLNEMQRTQAKSGAPC